MILQYVNQSPKRLLSDPLPLRSTTAWGNYSAPENIPVVYGQCTLKPVQYSQDRTKWCVADHAITSVDRVRRDGQDSYAYTWRNEVDSTGHAVAVIELADALADGEVLEVKITGKPLTNPADILDDLLNSVAGWGGHALLSKFRAECTQLGLVLGGAFIESMTVRAAVAEICTSIGAVWSGGLDGLAVFYPPTTELAPVATISQADMASATAQTSYSDLFTELTLEYDYDYANSKSLRSLTVEAYQSVLMYGRTSKTLQAKWIKSAKNAQELATRLLKHGATPQWSLSASINWRFRSLRAGECIDVSSEHIPSLAGIVSSIDKDYERATVNATVLLQSNNVVSVRIKQLASSWEPVQSSRIPVSYSNGVLTMTILDDFGEPLGLAEVTLDNAITRTANLQGIVQFTAARGRHTIYVEAVGYAPMSAELTV